MTSENINKNLSDSVTEHDTPTDTAPRLKRKDSVEKKDSRNLGVWRYFGYLKYGKEAQQHADKCR